VQWEGSNPYRMNNFNFRHLERRYGLRVQGALKGGNIVLSHWWVIPGQVITKNGRTPSDFNETWYMNTLSEVINQHPFLASYVIWLLSYNFSTSLVFGTFSMNQ